jgi:hypothetical protein
MTWLGSCGAHKMPKSVNTLSVVGPRQRPRLLSRAPSRHHDASTRVVSIWPLPEGVSSLDAEHPEHVRKSRPPVPVAG